MLLKKINTAFYYILKYPYYKMILGKIGSSSRLVSCKIDGASRIYLGSKVFINAGGWLASMPLTGSKDCKLSIGDGTYIGRYSHIYATSGIEIGKKVLIADKVYIADNLHQFENVNIPVIDQPVKQTAEVVIGDGAWLGENVCVIGASIGKQSVVGANSVVMKDIPDYCVAVGAPAKIIKRYSFEKNEWLVTNEKGEFIN